MAKSIIQTMAIRPQRPYCEMRVKCAGQGDQSRHMLFPPCSVRGGHVARHSPQYRVTGQRNGAKTCSKQTRRSLCRNRLTLNVHAGQCLWPRRPRLRLRPPKANARYPMLSLHQCTVHFCQTNAGSNNELRAVRGPTSATEAAPTTMLEASRTEPEPEQVPAVPFGKHCDRLHACGSFWREAQQSSNFSGCRVRVRVPVSRCWYLKP